MKIYTLNPGLRPHFGLPPKILLIMKIIILLLFTCLTQVSANTLAQRISLFEKNSSLELVLNKVKQQLGYEILFASDVISQSRNVSVSFSNVLLKDGLDKIFEKQPLTYELKDNTIIVRRKAPSFLDKVIERFTNIDVRGKVLDEKGNPLVGATVSVKGGTKSVKTNSKGEFSLQSVDEQDIIVVSYIGYQTREINAAPNVGSLALELADAKLEEVMINAGYYTVKDSERTGSISRITSKDIATQPVNNVLAVMQGRMAGVNITQTTGTPGGGFDIKIRGQNSIRTEGNAPLYIIDGVPYASDVIGAYVTTFGFPTPASPINSINSDNIESIEILKDADATAIYGSRGANGVVLITTKKGKPGKTTATFNAYTGVGKTTRFGELMKTAEYLAMRKQAFINDGLTEFGETDYDVNGTWDQNRYTDWQKELLGGTAETNNFQTTISGGTENSQFLISGNYRTESTVLPGNFLYKKGGVQASFNHQSTDRRFKLAFSANYNVQDNDQPAFDLTNDARYLAPNAPALYKTDGSLNWENETWTNPLAAALNGKFESATHDWVTNLVLSYEVLPRLVLKSSFGLTDLGTIETRVAPSSMYNPVYNPSSTNSYIQFNYTDRSSWIIEPQISWNGQWLKGKIDILLGGSFQSQNTSKLYQNGLGFSSNSLIYNLSAAKTVRITQNDLTAYRYQAFFGRFNYNYDQRFIVNLTARRDGSSRFGPGRQFANFGAIGAAWLFSNESFFKSQSWLSLGKLRASYGVTGSDQIGDYQFFDTYTTSGVAYNNNIGLQPTRLYNPDFAWETNKKLELALELAFLQDRIYFTGAWFKNRSSNQLVGIPFPGTSGFNSLQANLDATVQNTGVELTLRTDNFQSGQFSWSTNLNLSFADNKLVRFPGLAGSTYSQQYRIGRPLNIQLLYHLKGVNPQTGLYEFTDYNNDNKIASPEDRQSIADLSPKYFGGIQNQLRFKRWNLDFLFQFVKKKNAVGQGYAGSMAAQPHSFVGNTWQKPGDIARYQRYSTGVSSEAANGNYLHSYSDGTIVDVSYIRLKNISLSYDLPVLLKQTHCRLSLQGQNLLTFTGFTEGDPEFTTYGYLPPLKVITAGIQFTF
ncbi:catecholate siderophore receptor CirA [compost metagenome]